MIKGLARLIVALNANSRPWEIGAGAAFGLLLALVPGANLLWIALFVLTFFLKLNMAMQFLLMGLVRLLVPLVDPALDSLGGAVLTAPSLQGLFTALASAPVVPLTRFSSTLVMGGLLAGIVLWVPFLLLFTFLVKLYRRTLRERIAHSRLAKAMARVPLFAAVAKAAAGVGGAAGLGS
jgi:uncharacterized protein (TIGR03546 family)